jgi:hypothetical protein
LIQGLTKLGWIQVYYYESSNKKWNLRANMVINIGW